MINSLSLDDQHISYMINSAIWDRATIPPSSLAGGRRATEQKSESECIDTVCIVHGFMNNIIHNSSRMINIVDDGDEDNELNTVFELTHHGMATTVMRER